MKIMFVDDDGILQKHLSASLEFLGNDVFSIRSASAFLENVGSIPEYDVVLLDRMLRAPKNLEIKDSEEVGDALYRELRKKYPSHPVVFVTAKEMTEQEEENLGPYATVLLKPLLSSQEVIGAAEELF